MSEKEYKPGDRVNPEVGHILPFFSESMRFVICYYDGQEELAYITDHLGMILTVEESGKIMALIERYHEKYGGQIPVTNKHILLGKYYKPILEAADKPVPAPPKPKKEELSERKQAVYVIRETDNGVCKIGFVTRANGAKQRLGVFQSNSPKELYIWRVFEVIDGRSLEQHLLAIFADKKMRGEWFELTDDDFSRLEAEVEDWIWHNEF